MFEPAMSRTATPGLALLPIVERLAKKLKLDLGRYPRKSLIFARVGSRPHPEAA
jgi:hypothetical protein